MGLRVWKHLAQSPLSSLLPKHSWILGLREAFNWELESLLGYVKLGFILAVDWFSSIFFVIA